jgi:hypothetical protein
MEFARIGAIAQRLQQDSAAKQFLEAAQQRLQDSEAPLRNALAAFYMQSGRQGEGSIEFVHKSFGEFLCAERIVKSLIDWCQPGRNREYDIQDAEFCWQVYDLLGCHILTPEIVEYVTALLIKHEDVRLDLLHKRLYDFYWRWSDGEFIDAPPENLPQQKMRLLREHTSDRDEKLGQRQVDTYAGLNILILLLELHRYGIHQAVSKLQGGEKKADGSYHFHPCIRIHKGVIQFSPQILLRIISASHSIHCDFENLVGEHLSYADLSGSKRTRTNLSRTNLSYMNLSYANLSNVYLNGADLTGTDLTNADLTGTDLSGADLIEADLSGADLSGADFSRAFLSDSSGTVQWDKDTDWHGVIGLDSAIGVPDKLKRQLGLDRP